jgi:hypothetical protein
MFQPRISWSGRKLIALTYWGGAHFRTPRSYPQTWPTGPSWGLDPSQWPRWYLRMGVSRRDSSMQAWWAAGSVMLTQGSSACACAGGMQRGASAMAAAADTPISALFISCSFFDPLMAALLSPTPRYSVALFRLPTRPARPPSLRLHRLWIFTPWRGLRPGRTWSKQVAIESENCVSLPRRHDLGDA